MHSFGWFFHSFMDLCWTLYFLFDNTHHSRRGCGDMGMRLADMDGYIFPRILSTDGGVPPLISKQIS